MKAFFVALCGALAVAGCVGDDGANSGGAASTATGDAITTSASGDAATTSSTGGGVPVPNLTPCPTTGKGAIVAAGPCFTLTPEQAGASPLGENADEPEYALEPVGTPQGALLVELNGSGGTPKGQIASPTLNIYNAAAATGHHVIGLAYRSDKAVGAMCSGVDACFGASRRTIVLGAVEPDAAAELSDMREDESIVSRLEATLAGLAAARPGVGWEAFLQPGDTAAARIVWDRVVASGHSQGGGHAAMLGKLFAVRGVMQLSSTCDAVAGAPASWTSSTETWATSPHDRFVGLAAPTTFGPGGVPTGGDTICTAHVAVWTNLGMAPENMHDDAATCGETGNTHGASIGCVDNYDRWTRLLP